MLTIAIIVGLIGIVCSVFALRARPPAMVAMDLMIPGHGAPTFWRSVRLPAAPAAGELLHLIDPVSGADTAVVVLKRTFAVRGHDARLDLLVRPIQPPPAPPSHSQVV
jgi:hypothetical protein